MHSSIDRAFNKLFKSDIADFANEFENKFIKKYFLLLKEQSNCEIAENICENCEKRL